MKGADIPATRTVRAAPRATPAGARHRTKGSVKSPLADAYTRSPLRGVQWSVSYVGFLLYVGVITTYQLGIGDIAMAVALLGLPFERGRFRFPLMLGLLGAFLAWAAIGYTSTLYPVVVAEQLLNLAKLWLIVLVAVNVLNSGPRIRLFLIFWLLCFALYPARGTLVNYFVGGYSTFGRAIWNFIYANPNDLAALTLLQLSIAGGLFLSEGHRWIRRGALASLFVLPVIILLTQSRGAFIALAAFAIVALAGQRRRLRSIALAGTVLLTAMMFVPSSAWDRLGSVAGITQGEEAVGTLDEEGSAEQRWQIWKTAGMIIQDHPLFGVGWGAYPEANAVYAGWSGPESTNRGKRDTHSTYLNVLAELGWPGLLLFIGMVAAVVVPTERVRRQLQALYPARSAQMRLLELGLLAFLLAGVFGSYSRLSFLYLHMASLWAVADVLRQNAKRGRTAAVAGGSR